MSRKDVIIIAALVNAALLMLLFATASIYDSQEKKEVEKSESVAEIFVPRAVHEEPVLPVDIHERVALDEIDEVMQEYTRQRDVIAKAEEPAVVIPQPVVKDETIEVVVKNGDVLSKIAKTYKVRVQDIMRVNNLTTTALKIGQVLKIPKVDMAATKSAVKTAAKQESDIVYTVKSGDNPWKIARKFHVQYEDILKWNQLDEEKARNLKVGQKIHIKQQ